MNGGSLVCRPAVVCLGVLLISLGLTGCGDSDQVDLESYVRKVQDRDPGPIDPLPEIKQVATFVYEPGDRRDPFVADSRSSEAETADPGNSLAPDPLRRKEELEGYSLDALRMVGTIEQNKTNWALIRTQDGTLHRVRVGNYLGNNNGQITSITDDEVQLTEVVSEGTGGWRERPATISLAE